MSVRAESVMSAVKPHVEASMLPATLLHKAQMHWGKVHKFLSALDKEKGNTGKVTREELVKMCDTIACDLTEREVDRVMGVFKDAEGSAMDGPFFVEVLDKILNPPAYSDGLSLNFSPNFRPKRVEGRAKNFKGLRSDWNNAYHQSLDLNGTGKPVLENIIQGIYFHERTNPYVRPNTVAGPPFVPQGTTMDARKPGQPLVKSLIQGDFYKNHARPKTCYGDHRDKIDFIAHNRKMTREYSRLIAGTRPHTAMSRSAAIQRERDNLQGSLSTGPYQTISAMSTTREPVRTPRNARELQDMWGRPLDPTFIATTLAWLGRATDLEKRQFKQAVVYPTAISAKAGTSGAHPFQTRTRSTTPYMGGGTKGSRVPTSRPQSATGVRSSDHQELMQHQQQQQRPMVAMSPAAVQIPNSPSVQSRERPLSRTGIDRGALDAATAFAAHPPPQRDEQLGAPRVGHGGAPAPPVEGPLKVSEQAGGGSAERHGAGDSKGNHRRHLGSTACIVIGTPEVDSAMSE
eukprot:CAMPEP_0173419868 /NCGR_PEP_ID=MMETSP1357-20121228/1555_1 /TAXON_ID=77926 /ORGANISM="Hemiselmis rufescens, Strain PCC563" /LENGTH=515 /DNA_ID=CAMNT_0014382577 /DNA_START=229 /DNA_END=1775 /DNA_ORIENTATION=+